MCTVSVRYMIDDVPTAIRFYTMHLGFAIEKDASPAFASPRSLRALASWREMLFLSVFSVCSVVKFPWPKKGYYTENH